MSLVDMPMMMFSRNPRVVVAPAPFKGSLTAAKAAYAIADGIRRVIPQAQIVLLPLSDGGEGLVTVLHPAMDAETRVSNVAGPLPDQRINAEWALGRNGQTAVIEMAAAAGLALVPENRRDPGITTTQGVGELIVAAMDAGASRIILGLGGSATNDGGSGMARALGYRFVKLDGSLLPHGGNALAMLHHIDSSQRDRRLDRISVIAACDVANSFFGPAGAAVVYGPQKGGTPDALRLLDKGMEHLADVMKRDLDSSVVGIPGAGAAGGLGGGVIAFLHGSLKRGIDVVLDALGFDDILSGADVIVTGEGRLDSQTQQGKVIQGILDRAHRAGIPVMAVVGSMLLPAPEARLAFHLEDVETLVAADVSLDMAMVDAEKLLQERATTLFKRHFPS